MLLGGLVVNVEASNSKILPYQYNSSTSYVGILYAYPNQAEVVAGANWVGVILSDPLDRTDGFKPFVDRMHSAGLLVAGTIYRPTVEAAISAALKAKSFGFDMIILDELLSRGVFDAASFNELVTRLRISPRRNPVLVVGMSDYDVAKMTQFLAEGAKPDFIAITTYYADLAICKANIDAVAALAAQYKIPAYDWVTFADPRAITTTDQIAMSALANYAKSKVNGVWFWMYGDVSWSGWVWGDWYLKNYDYVKSLVPIL